MDAQAYYTPKSLATKAWAKFKNKEVTRLLEPSVGEAHLLEPYLEKRGRWEKTAPIDCLELDLSKHPLIRSKGLNVVGLDFMDFNGGSLWSHILLNPPFENGVKHVLKGWELLFDGELVAIINAESIRNAYSAERKMLVNIIESFGSVEFLQDEFMTSDTERKTSVEIALIHLEKTSNFEVNFLSGLEVDSMTASGLTGGFKEFNEIAVHQGMIENSVIAFNAAVKAAREEAFAAARTRYYTSLLGDSMETLLAKESNRSPDAVKTNLDHVRNDLQSSYDDLKNRAWTQILRSTQVTARLSSNAQKRLESEFENVKQLEFSTSNIYGFILGLINKQSEINIEMACDVFDSITSRYHSGNRYYFKGWKSNDKHRTAAFKIKHTRFVIPGHGHDGWRGSPSWDTCRFLADFDKVFAMLAGVKEVELSLEAACKMYYNELLDGKRISSSYFDLRLYKGVGTLHFYPTNLELIRKLNSLVGRHRQWLPPAGEKASSDFWLQYEKAEKFATQIEAEIAKQNRGRSYWNGIEQDITSSDDERRNAALAGLDTAIDTVLVKHGIDPATLLESSQEQASLPVQAALPLLAAA